MVRIIDAIGLHGAKRLNCKVPARQPKRGRLWLGDGAFIRLRSERREPACASDLVEERAHDGRRVRTLDVGSESTRSCSFLSGGGASDRPGAVRVFE